MGVENIHTNLKTSRGEEGTWSKGPDMNIFRGPLKCLGFEPGGDGDCCHSYTKIMSVTKTPKKPRGENGQRISFPCSTTIKNHG